MNRPLRSAIISVLVSAPTACVPPIYTQVTPGVAHDDVVYAFEVDRQKGDDDTVKVVVCHRFGNPPCVSIRATQLDEPEEYGSWRADAERRRNAAQRRPHERATDSYKQSESE